MTRKIIDYSVVKDHRNKGYGYILLKDCIKKNQNLKLLKALVHKRNKPSIKIFKKLNFYKHEYKSNNKFYIFTR